MNILSHAFQQAPQAGNKRIGVERLVVPAIIALLLSLASAGQVRAITLNPGDLVVANGSLVRIDPATGSQTLIAPAGVCCSGQSLVIAPNGDILGVVGGSSPRVVRINPTTGAVTTVSSGPFFVSPSGIAMEPSGAILVTDLGEFVGDGRVIRVDPVTGVQVPLSSGGFFSEPLSLAVAATGDIFVVDSAAFGGSGGVIRVDPVSGIQTAVSSGGNFRDPSGIALEANGNIVVADPAGVSSQGGIPGLIIRVAPLTGAQTVVSSADRLVDPWGIAVAANGNIFISDPNGYTIGARVVRVNPSTGAQTIVSSGGALTAATGIAIVPGPTNRPPSVTCPGPIDTECSSGSGSPATLTAHVEDPDGNALTVRWIVDGVEVQVDNVPAGGPPTAADVTLQHTFAVGSHTVEVVVSDGQAEVRCSTTVHVADTTPPTITAPPNVHAATGVTATCSVLVDDATLGSPVASDSCGNVSVTRSGVPAGNIFPVGQTLVTYTATDDHGNTATAIQIVTVADATRPSIACPADISVSATTSAGAIVQFPAPVAADNCSVAQVAVDPPSGSLFRIGTTAVTAIVTDASGNTASCSFSVTVGSKGARDIKKEVLDDLIRLRGDTDRHHGKHLLDEAIQHLRDSLQSWRWIDANHLRSKHGDRVFKAEKAAVHALLLLKHSKRHHPSDEVLRDLIDRLVRADRMLAESAIDDAASANGKRTLIAIAREQLADGDSDAASHRRDAAELAIGHYRNAWRLAQLSVGKLRHPGGGTTITGRNVTTITGAGKRRLVSPAHRYAD